MGTERAGGAEARTTGAPRRRGRAARVAERRAGTVPVDPCPPGQRGGRYRPLSEREVGRVLDAAFAILSEIGMAEAPAALRDRALARGARLTGDGRLAYPRALVEDVVAGAARRFVLHGRDPAHDIEVGGDRTYFGTGGAAVQVLDPETGRYRPSTLADLHAFARLADRLPNLSWFTRCCVATDVADMRALDLETAYALLCGTAKPVGTSFALAAHVDPVVDMFDIALGGAGRFAARPFCKAHVSPVISPLRYGADAAEVIAACIRRRMPINCIIAAQSGATAPAAPAAMLAQSTAETLAGLMLVDLFAPGYPVIFSNWPFVIDLRSGAFAGGGGETALLNAASAQLANRLGLPSGVAASMADAKAVDAQMGVEKGLSALSAGLAGANMVYESAGMTASLLGVSPAAFVADDEMLSHINRILRGIEVDDAALDLAPIRAAATGTGHYLGSAETMAAMQRDHFYPALADRERPEIWEARGGRDMAARAAEKARAILAEPPVRHLGRAADAAIRARYGVGPGPA